MVQALIARALVEDMGVSTRRAAQLLGIAPSAVSMYLRGKRRVLLLDDLGGRPELSVIAHRAASSLAGSRHGAKTSAKVVLEAALEVASKGESPKSPGETGPAAARIDRRAVRRLHARVAAEQEAVAGCMQLAQKARDELTRAIFRQIASDSLRHAEIVASLAVYLEAGTNRSLASGIDRADVEGLIRQEHEAEGEGIGSSELGLGGVMKLLVQSMSDDEKKHDRLLQGLLREGFAG